MTYATGAAGNAAVDLKAALDLARDHGEGRAAEALLDLVFGYLPDRLGALSAAQLERHLGQLQVWRREAGCAVFRTVDEPALAYCALRFGSAASGAGAGQGGDAGVNIVVLGVFYRYPGTEEEWWQAVVRPRLRLYL